jgi:hypothetical protein
MQSAVQWVMGLVSSKAVWRRFLVVTASVKRKITGIAGAHDVPSKVTLTMLKND